MLCKGEKGSWNNNYFRDLDENNKIINKSFKNPHGKKSIIGFNLNNINEEIYFNSISEAAQKMNTDRGSISKCIQGSDRYSNVKGYIWRELDLYGNIIETEKTVENRIKEYNEKNPLINGERHNIREWCKIYNISPTCFYRRKNKGMNSIEALTLSERK